MASLPHNTPEQAPTSAPEGEERRPSRPPKGHKDRFRASLAWALDAYANTLAKLAK
jgi:hypothetical protein